MKYRNKYGFFAIAFALIAGAVSTQSAQAADLRYARGEVVGDGQFKIENDRNRNETNKVKNVKIAFEQNNRFDIRFTPNNSATFNVSGTWSRSSNDTVSFVINDGAGRGSYSGNGTLTFKVRNGQRQPSFIKFNGRRTVRRAVDFELKFDASGVRDYTTSWDSGNGGGSGDNGKITQLFTTKNGSGRVEVTGQGGTNIRTAKLELSKNGDARIELTGSQSWVFEGKWDAFDSKRLRITLDSASSTLRGARWLGRGQVTLKNGSFERLNLSGQLGKDSFAANFTVN